MYDILCLWHQLLPEEYLNLFNDVAERDLCHHLQLPTGRPITKSIIDQEIKKFKITKADRVALLLKVQSGFISQDQPIPELQERSPDPLTQEHTCETDIPEMPVKLAVAKPASAEPHSMTQTLSAVSQPASAKIPFVG